MRFRSFFFFWLILYSTAFSQLTLKNQFKFSRWKNYDLKIVENWTDIAYQKSNWEAGIRFEINRPPDPFVFQQDSLLKNYELTYRYIEFTHENFSATVGNFYEIFGRGLVLRSYEDRNLRVDTNIEGARVKQSGDNYQLKALAGRMRDKYNRRDNWIFGIDGELSFYENLILGASALRQTNSISSSNALYSLRLQNNWDWGEVYAEIAKPEWYNKVSFYNSWNFYSEKWTAAIEFKNYDHLAFVNNYGTEYNAAPSLTRQHAYTLLNRHPHALDMNDEKGYQLELTYIPQADWELTVNHSLTLNHDDKQIFKEFYAEIFKEWENRAQLRLIGAWSYDLATNTKNIIPITDIYYNLNERNQLHFSYQHQHVINNLDKSEYDNDLLLAEITHSPLFTFAIVGEITNQDQLRNVTLARNKWLYFQTTVQFSSSHQMTIMYGARQAGFICVGGICRYVPEFEGWEISFLNRF